MIICHSRRYVFIHIHKTGGSSVEAALEPTLAWDDLLLGSTPFGEQCNQHYRRQFGLSKHSNLEEIHRICRSCSQIQNYRVISVVREPLQRAVSLFNFNVGVLDRIRQSLGISLGELWQSHGEFCADHPQLTWPAIQALLASRLDFDAFIASPELEEARGFHTQVSQLSIAGVVPETLTWIDTSHLSQAHDLLYELAGAAVTVEHLNPSTQRLVSADAVGSETKKRIHDRFAVDYQQFGF